MFSTSFVPVLLLCFVTAADCQVSKTHGSPDCQQKLKFWKAESAKIQPGTPQQRIRAIEAIGAHIGEDPERCTSEKIRRAIQNEKARLVRLSIDHKTVPPAAVYSCIQLTVELKCNSSVADDTAHLSESPIPELEGTRQQRFKFDIDPSIARAEMHVYSAAEATLMDKPEYVELTADEIGAFSLPALSGRAVLFAIVKDNVSGLYDKFVWLIHFK